MKTRVMFIERKAGNLQGPARIGRVTFSKSGKTVYYKRRSFRSLKGAGFKSNYYEVASGEHYWISGPKRNGRDGLYGGHCVPIDADVREEYWTQIRKQPDRKDQRYS